MWQPAGRAALTASCCCFACEQAASWCAFCERVCPALEACVCLQGGRCCFSPAQSRARPFPCPPAVMPLPTGKMPTLLCPYHPSPTPSSTSFLPLLQDYEAQRFALEQRILELEAARMEGYVRAEDHAGLAGARTSSKMRHGAEGDRRGGACTSPCLLARCCSQQSEGRVGGADAMQGLGKASHDMRAPPILLADARDELNRRLVQCQDDLERSRRATAAAEEQVRKSEASLVCRRAMAS